MEICNKRNIGSDRLFTDFLYFYIEKKIEKFTVDLFTRSLIVLGDKQFIEDPIFWIEHMFPWVYQRAFNKEEATLLWTSLITLRIKCPSIS